jgi:hemolysin type calcium-binding protein
VVRRGHLIAVVGTFLIWGAVLLAVGCAGTSSETSKKEQEPTEATKKEQTRSPEAMATEEARCQGTRPFVSFQGIHLTTNDLPGCPKGGLLLGTDKHDRLGGKKGDDEIRGRGDRDEISGGPSNDIIYGGPGNDDAFGGGGYDVIYGGDGNDFIFENRDGGHNKIYCGEGKDTYGASKNDYVSSSCEKKVSLKIPPPGGKGIDYD